MMESMAHPKPLAGITETSGTTCTVQCSAGVVLQTQAGSQIPATNSISVWFIFKSKQ